MAYRKKVDYRSLTRKQRVAFDLNQALRKNKSYILSNFKGENLGNHVDFLPSCLDPDTKSHVFERIVIGKDEPIGTIHDLQKNMPVLLNFYPSDQIITKLVLRSLQIKDPEKELWEGFHPVKRADGSSVMKPNDLI